MMERSAALVLLLVFLAPSAHGAVQNFFGTLTGAQEKPNAVVTNGSGNGTASYDSVTDILTVHVDYTGLGSNSTLAHIHCCAAPTTTAPVAIDFVSAGFPLGATSGTYDHMFPLNATGTYTGGFLSGPGGGTAAGARNALLAAMNIQNAYFNIHTTVNGGGEIRGNISPVPEPAALVLLVSGLTALVCWRRARYVSGS